MVARLHQAKQRQVVALGAAAGEDDLRRTAVQQLGNLLARLLDRGARLLSLLMNGRGIAKLLEEVRPHRLKHLRQKRRGRVIVEIDTVHEEQLSVVSCEFGCGRPNGQLAIEPLCSILAD